MVAPEQAQSLEAAANEVRRPEDDGAVELPGAMRWVRRRVRLVHHVVSLVIGLLPEPLARCIAEMGAVRTRLGTDCALRALRVLTAEATESLDTLNRTLWAWVEGAYHRSPHRGLDGRTPLDPWALAGHDVCSPDPGTDLDDLFLFETKRRVMKNRNEKGTTALHHVAWNGQAEAIAAFSDVIPGR